MTLTVLVVWALIAIVASLSISIGVNYYLLYFYKKLKERQMEKTYRLPDPPEGEEGEEGNEGNPPEPPPTPPGGQD